MSRYVFYISYIQQSNTTKCFMPCLYMLNTEYNGDCRNSEKRNLKTSIKMNKLTFTFPVLHCYVYQSKSSFELDIKFSEQNIRNTVVQW